MTWNGGETYNVVAHIGKGAFANVYKLATKQDGELFAAKEIEKRRFIKDGILSGKAHNEIDVMKQLDHVRPFFRKLNRGLIRVAEYHQVHWVHRDA